mgnify:CR=1 FL=1
MLGEKNCTTRNIHQKIQELQSDHDQQIKAIQAKKGLLEKSLQAIPTHQRWRIQERNALKRQMAGLESSVQVLQHRHQQCLMAAMDMEEARKSRSIDVGTCIGELNPDGASVDNFNKIEYTKCLDCGQLLEKMVDASVMICSRCGVSSKYLETTRDGLSFNEDVEFVNSYQKKNHLQEWINTTQGRETAPIPKPVITAIKRQLYKMGVRSSAAITRNVLYQALKDLKLRKYYKNQTSILSQLTGLKPKRILSHEENQITLMFTVLQPIYEKHIPKNRTNFQSYPYTLYKLTELIGMYWIRPYFKLLKGGAVLHKQDETWKKICKDTGWRYIPSI